MFSPNDVYDTYWEFAYKRQTLFFNRYKNIESNEFLDPILDRYKFTNCYRVLDRTTQALVRKVIYNQELSSEDAFFQIVLFKLFNKEGTWDYLNERLGFISSKEFDETRLGSLLLERKKTGEAIYSSAYIMPSGKKEFGSPLKHENNLKLIGYMLRNDFHKKIWSLDLEDTYNLFLSVPTIGPFLAYQYSIDIAYSHFSEASENQFVIAGPGALRGIEKCFGAGSKKHQESIIKEVADRQNYEFSRLGYSFKYLVGRPLQLIDCQNIFCELDKYLRVRRPDLNNGNTRIKQVYRKKEKGIDFLLPTKWMAKLPY